MSVRDIEFLIQEWIDLGLTPLERVDGVVKFKDLCIVDMFSGVTRPCDWIEYSSEENILFMKGKPKGEIISRENT